MSDFALNSTAASTPPAIAQAVRPPQPAQPPKSQSDHKALNEATSSRGPAVVLSGALAKPADRQRQSSNQGQGQSQPGGGQAAQASSSAATGQHINHVI
jgi:hypothetical protein